MRRALFSGALLIVPALLILSTAPGCGKKDTKPPAPVDAKAEADKKAEGDKGAAKKGKTAIGEKLGGIVKGRVLYDGTPPEPEPQPEMKAHKDGAHCLAGKEFEKVKQQWFVNKDNKGVENVMVFLKAPKGTYFKVDDKDVAEAKKKVVKLQQPHCAFIPHVEGIFPKYFDGAKEVKTGEVFEVINNAEFAHNTKWTGDALKGNSGNETLAPKATKVVNLAPDLNNPTRFACDFHPWMTAFVWSFDHPYFAVTDKDGHFEIKNAPTGVELEVIAWHEAKPNFYKEKKSFMQGENKLGDLKVSK